MAIDEPGGAGPARPPVRLPDLGALHLLVLVAETGSLGRAAARLRISQPTASERMRTLERRLGLQLLVRATTGSQLTPAGQVVTDWARTLLEQAGALVEGVAALRAQQRGSLKVAASLTLAEQLLPGWLAVLREGRPDVHVSLRVANTHQVVEALRHGEADLGFIEGPWTPPDLTAAPVGRDRLVVVAAPGHPWARRRTPVTGAELAATPLLLRESGSGTRETLEHALRPWHGPQVPVLELGSTTPLRAAALSGTAPAVLSELAVRQDLLDGRLVEVPHDQELSLARTLHAVWRSGNHLSEPAVDLLRAARRTAPR